MATQVDICNMAARKIGADPITLISDSVKVAEICNLIYDDIRDQVLQDHPWKFAQGRYYRTVSDMKHTVTGITVTGTTSATVTATTITATNMPAYFRAYFESLGGSTELNLLTLPISTSGSGTLTVLTDTSVSAWTSGGTVRLRPYPNFEYAYDLPSDFLQPIEMLGTDSGWELQAGLFLTEASSIDLLYTKQITDETLFSPVFIQAFAARLAAELAYPVTRKRDIEKDMYSIYGNTLAQAQITDARAKHGPRKHQLKSAYPYMKRS